MQNGHSQKVQKLVFKYNYRLMQVKSIAECSKESILHYFQPSLSYHLSLRSLFCLILIGRFTHVLLYSIMNPQKKSMCASKKHCAFNFTCWVISHAFNAICRPISKLIFSKNSSRNTIRMSKDWDPDQEQQNVVPDLGPNFFPRLSADNKSRH